MTKRLQDAKQHRYIPTSVSALLEQKRRRDEAVAINAARVGKSSQLPFVPATAMPELTNPLATPGSGMFSDTDPLAPSG